mmetsp:Transcript_1531/g.6676  ORF Transcript_1531/g.6676 Transcript_1531/m.6676 type:complete len:260 (+) Transcript_1531:683-1462(+)
MPPSEDAYSSALPQRPADATDEPSFHLRFAPALEAHDPQAIVPEALVTLLKQPQASRSLGGLAKKVKSMAETSAARGARSAFRQALEMVSLLQVGKRLQLEPQQRTLVFPKLGVRLQIAILIKQLLLRGGKVLPALRQGLDLRFDHGPPLFPVGPKLPLLFIPPQQSSIFLECILPQLRLARELPKRVRRQSAVCLVSPLRLFRPSVQLIQHIVGAMELLLSSAPLHLQRRDLLAQRPHIVAHVKPLKGAWSRRLLHPR